MGLLLLGNAMGFIREAAMGVDPYSAMILSLGRLVGLSFGNGMVLMNGLLLLVMLWRGRGYIGIGTLANMFVLGYISDATVWLLKGFSPGLPLRILFLVVGVVLLCFSASLYMAPDMGLSPYDATATLLARDVKKLSFRVARIGTDSLCVLLALACLLFSGRPVLELIGPGTILTALCTGPLIQFFRTHVADPLLLKGCQKGY